MRDSFSTVLVRLLVSFDVVSKMFDVCHCCLRLIDHIILRLEIRCELIYSD